MCGHSWGTTCEIQGDIRRQLRSFFSIMSVIFTCKLNELLTKDLGLCLFVCVGGWGVQVRENVFVCACLCARLCLGQIQAETQRDRENYARTGAQQN